MKPLLLLTLIFLTSCSTVHKLSSKTSSSSDSTSVTHLDETASSRHDSSVTKESADTWTRETVIEYSPDDTNVVQLGKASIYGTANPAQPGYALYRPTRITIRETGTSQAKQSATYTNADTSSKKADSKTAVAKDSKEVKTDKKKTGMDFGFWIAAAGVILVSGAFFWITRKFKTASEVVETIANKA